MMNPMVNIKTKPILLALLYMGIASNLFCQEITTVLNDTLRKNSFEVYAYLISQDALGTNDAYTVAASINLIGEFVLLGKTNKKSSTHFDYWLYTTEPSNPEESVPELAQKAGLLWNTNDFGTSIFTSGIGVMAFRQQLFQDKLSIRAGKLFPGVYYQSNYYAPNNSETHMNSMLTSNPVSSWFGSLGIGLIGEFEDEKWFGKLGIHDATADDELDFKSLSDGKFLYITELGLKQKKSDTENRISLLYSYTDELTNKTAEHSISLGGVYYFGTDQLWGTYARYSFRDGGKGKDAASASEENAVKNGGFVGISRTAPWRLAKSEIGGSYFIGQPSNYQVSLGSNTQYGIETYFKYNFKPLIQAAFDFQLVNTGNAFVPIIGARFKAGWSALF